MGKMKWSVDSESNAAQQEFRSGIAHARRRKTSAPGKLVQQPLEAIPLPQLLRQIYLRIRRNWIAFRYQANRYTFGVFRQRTFLKLGVLAGTAYVLLFSRQEFWILSGSARDTVSTGYPVETALEVDDPKTIKWQGEKGREMEKAPRWKEKNGAAPVAAFELSADKSQLYIARFGKIATEEMRRYGIPASICMAQGLVESRYGTSTLAVRNNNHFGMKCFSRKCKKGHCSNFSDDHHKDFFRIYTNPWESWRAHSQMLASGRYARLKKYGRDYRKWAYGLEQLGYATDRSYAEKLIGVVEQFNLQRFDRQ